jgi:3-hydroxyacyl-[acyl-carrier-protein] dehydratase
MVSKLKDDSLEIISIDSVQILQYQQNRFPLLFIDKVTTKPLSWARSIKNFTYNEWFFPSHFPDEPNVPGFILLENLAQTFIMTFLSHPQYKGEKTAFVKVEELFFRSKVVPGNQILTTAKLDSLLRGVAIGSAESRMTSLEGEGEIVASAKLTVAIPTILNGLLPRK